MLSGVLAAQNAAQADALFQAGEYRKANVEYLSLVQRDPRNTLYLYRYARCQYEIGEKQTAAEYFEKAGERYALRNYYLGELYIDLYRPTEALACLDKYAATIDEQHERYPRLMEMMERANTLQRLMTHVEHLQVIDSVDIPENQWLSAYQLSPESGILSRSGYMSERGDRRIRVQEGVLYRQEKLLDTWSDPEPIRLLQDKELGYPYLLSDGVTLYFAARSKVPETTDLGGWDIYMTKYNSATESYLTPVLMPLPINSQADDYMLAIDEVRSRGYFATNRGKSNGHITVYTFVPREVKTYWRDTTEKYLAEEVMHPTLSEKPVEEMPIAVAPTTEPSAAAPIATKAEEPASPTFALYLSADRVYESVDDIEDDSLRALCEQYLQQVEAVANTRRALAEARRSYSQVPTDSLAETILALEKTLLEQKREEQQLLTRVRAY